MRLKEKDLEILFQLSERAFQLQNKFIKKFNQKWNLRESCAELGIQIGHLAQALIENNKIPTNKHSWQQYNRNLINNIADELADCFLSICSIFHFAKITNDEIEKFPPTVIIDNNYSKLLIELHVLSMQLLDSAEVYDGLKPKFHRDERLLLLSSWRNLLHILTYIVLQEKIDIIWKFKQMEESATKFLEGEVK